MSYNRQQKTHRFSVMNIRKFEFELWSEKFGCWLASNVFPIYDINEITCLIWFQIGMTKVWSNLIITPFLF